MPPNVPVITTLAPTSRVALAQEKAPPVLVITTVDNVRIGSGPAESAISTLIELPNTPAYFAAHIPLLP